MNCQRFVKGQGATEYLVLLAVVLIVAMVAIALLGFFPGLAGDAKKAQSDAYWRGTARPFSILEHSQQSGTTNITLLVQNVEANQQSITNLSISGSGLHGSLVPATDQSFFSGGEKKVLVIPLSGSCTAGNSYEYHVNFTFSNSDGTISNQKQYGEKTLIGKCA
ncbi:MAG: hypothetical protein WC492_04465 [Candidatus Micrarchaeia archaeon]